MKLLAALVAFYAVMFALVLTDRALAQPVLPDCPPACDVLEPIPQAHPVFPPHPPPVTPAPAPPPAPPPSPAVELGVNLAWYDCTPLSGVVRNYHFPGVREQVLLSLQGQKRARVMLWFMNDVGAHVWGPVPTSLPEPYAGNLARIAQDVRAAGVRLEIAFGPQWVNDPIADHWDVRNLDVNWAFMQKVRGIVGPDADYDLLNEGGSWAANAYRVDPYVREIWNRWGRAYGHDRATVSFHAGRWRPLLAALDPDPSWFEVHVYDEHGAAFDVPPDQKPIVVGETYVDRRVPPDPRVTAVLSWPTQRTNFGHCTV